MPEGFNMSAGVPGANRDYRDRPKKRFEKAISLKALINWINHQNYDTHTKKELIKKASVYPYSSLRYFADNINAQVIKINEERNQLRKEKDERERQDREAREKTEKACESEPSSDTLSS